MSDNLPSYISLGKYSYMGNVNVSPYHDGKLSIGKFCSISNGVHFLIGGHHMKEWVSQYPFYDQGWLKSNFPDMPNIEKEIPQGKGIEIGNDVWIGNNAMLLDGVSVGNGCVIGAGAVVRPTIYDVYGNRYNSIPAYSIVVGNTAVITGRRFDVSVIAQLQKISWWDWSDERIKEALPLLLDSDIEKFIYRYSE